MTSRNSLLLMALLLLAVISLGLLFMPSEAPGILDPNEDGLGVEQSSAQAEEIQGSHDAQPLKQPEATGREAGVPNRQNVKLKRHARVQVLNHDNWKPLINTPVYFLTKEHKEQHPDELKNFAVRNPWGSANFESLPHELTDEEGIATLEFDGNILWMYVKVGNLRGRMPLKLGADPNHDLDELHTLFIRQTEIFEVSVLERDGSLALNVPVALRLSHSGFQLGDTGTTGASGVAVIDIPKDVFDSEFTGAAGDEQSKELQAVALLPFFQALTEIFPDVRGGGRQANIALPDHGGVEIHVENQTEDSYFYLRCEPAGNGQWRYLKPSSQIQPGTWRNNFIPLGQELEIGISSTYLKGSNFVDPQLIWKGKGPSSGGEIIPVQLDLLSGSFLSGRLLHADGMPLSKARIDLVLLDSNAMPVGGVLHQSTGDSGEFRIILDLSKSDLASVENAWIRTAFRRSTGTGAETGSSDYSINDLSDLHLSGANLGDLRPLKKMLLVSGQVVDESGKALPGVGVQLEKNMGQESGGDLENLQQKMMDHFGARTNQDGRFEIFQAELPVDLQFAIKAQAPSYAPTRKEIQVGEKDVNLVLSRFGNLKYALKSNLFGPETISLALIPTGEITNLDAYRGTQYLNPDAKFRTFYWNDVVPGIYRFTASDRQGELLAEVNGVEVLPGRTAHDPRLMNLILEDSDSIITVSLFDESGEPISLESGLDLASLRIYQHDTNTIEMVKLNGNHASYKAVEAERSAISLVGNQIEMLSLRGVQNGDQITLKKLPVLNIYVVGVGELPAEIQFDLYLAPGENDDSYRKYLTGRGHAKQINEGEFAFPLPTEGSYELAWMAFGKGLSSPVTSISNINIDSSHLKDGLHLSLPQSFIEQVHAKANGH